MTGTCGDCKWWDAIPQINETFGLCCIRRPKRGFSRVVTVDGKAVKFKSSLPIIYRDNWCGEHQPKEPTDAG